MRNGSSSNETETGEEWISQADAVWQLRSAFLIMTMQSGFALLEAGCISSKNVANIMVKNVVDVALGGLFYWCIGFGLSYGVPSTPFCGLGYFFLNEFDSEQMGSLYTNFLFQFSFASTATTIISGAIAERMTLHAYMILSLFNTFTYCFPASWVWNTDYGFLAKMGFYDFAGALTVHGNGGASALVACIMLGPRENRFTDNHRYKMSSPVTALAGSLMLWWAWFGFNSGSTLGVDEGLWRVSALVSTNTLMGSVGGACAGILASMSTNGGRVIVEHLINSILGGLVAITAICSVTSTAECLFIGAMGGIIALGTACLLEYFAVDDPVSAIPVHLMPGVWGTLAVGLFGRRSKILRTKAGLFHEGGYHLLGIQVVGIVLITLWSAVTTYLILLITDKIIGIRMSLQDEIAGADCTEHGIQQSHGTGTIGPACVPLFMVSNDNSSTVPNGKIAQDSKTHQVKEAKYKGFVRRKHKVKMTEQKQNDLESTK